MNCSLTNDYPQCRSKTLWSQCWSLVSLVARTPAESGFSLVRPWCQGSWAYLQTKDGLKFMRQRSASRHPSSIFWRSNLWILVIVWCRSPCNRANSHFGIWMGCCRQREPKDRCQLTRHQQEDPGTHARGRFQVRCTWECHTTRRGSRLSPTIS